MNPASTPDRTAVLRALDQVVDPKSGRGLVAARLVHGLTLEPGRAAFVIEIASADAALYAPVREAAERALAAVPGVTAARVVLTGAPSETPPGPGVTRVRKGARIAEDPQAHPGPPPGAERPARVGRVIAVASGKGGVGKSTVSVNLAVSLAGLGLRVGLLDADVYGPSAPRMLGVDGEPVFGEEKKLIPLEAWGLQVMSIGFLVDEAAPMIWRGPMASSAVRQMIHDVAWGSEGEPLDVLVVDLPPGTGDIQLTLVQKLKLDGVVIVSTPQEIALIDARRAAAMFQKTGAPILGVIENMAWFADPTTGARIPIFGEGGARAEAARLGVPLLAEIPIEIALREACDAGRPLAAVAPDSPSARAFAAAARALMALVEKPPL